MGGRKVDRPVEVSNELISKFFPKAAAALRGERLWGYPIGLETVTLIYNKNFSTVLRRRSYRAGVAQPEDQTGTSG
jgi:hypothetical protein